MTDDYDEEQELWDEEQEIDLEDRLELMHDNTDLLEEEADDSGEFEGSDSAGDVADIGFDGGF